MKLVRLIALAIVVIVLAPVDLSFAKQSHTYRIGLGPWIGFGPLYLAQDKGFFKKRGVVVDLVVLTGLAERNAALKAGKIEALAAPVDYFALAAGNNLETMIVMAIDESTGGDGIVARRDIANVEDLKGKHVAFQRGLPGEFFLRALLQSTGLSLHDIRSVDMETAQAGAAFIAGHVDAAVVWEPWLSKAVDSGAGQVLASTKDFPNLVVDVLAFNQETFVKSSKDVLAIVAAILDAISYWQNNPEEANRIMAPHFQVSPEKYALILKGASFTDLSRNRSYFGSSDAKGPIYDVAKRASAIWKDAGMISAEIDPNRIISPIPIHNVR
ncbi:MAG: ABC transporter substrate-binding protein [Magnetococcales bacterium]|nr:ABC transporter substrate-binding protein [Magnetococcales bacterium]